MCRVADDLTPYGELLERARGAMSKRAAAKEAGISEGRWRQIVTGRQLLGGGQWTPARPRRETLIAMATAVQADVAEVLTAAGMDVGPLDEDAGYVAAPGDHEQSAITNEQLLIEIRAVRRDLSDMREDHNALSRRVARIESSPEPLGGPDGQA